QDFRHHKLGVSFPIGFARTTAAANFVSTNGHAHALSGVEPPRRAVACHPRDLAGRKLSNESGRRGHAAPPANRLSKAARITSSLRPMRMTGSPPAFARL